MMLLLRLLVVGGLALISAISAFVIFYSLIHDEWKVSIQHKNEQVKKMKTIENLWIRCDTRMDGAEVCKNLGFKIKDTEQSILDKRGLLVVACLFSIASSIMLVSDITICSPKYAPHVAGGCLLLLAGIFAITAGKSYEAEIDAENIEIKLKEEEMNQAGNPKRVPVLYYAYGSATTVAVAGGVLAMISGILRLVYALHQGKMLNEFSCDVLQKKVDIPK